MQKNEQDNSLLNDEYAGSLFSIGQIDTAIIYENRSVNINPNITNVYHLGLYYAQKKNLSKAIWYYKKALSLYIPIQIQGKITNSTLHLQENIALEEIYNHLSVAYILNNQLLDTISLIKGSALKKFPDDPELYTSLAVAYYQGHNKQSALENAEKAYKLKPNQSNAGLYYLINNNLPLNIRTSINN